MLTPQDFLIGGVLPGVVALVVRAVVLRVTSADRIAWPAAVALGYAAGHAGLLAQEGSATVLFAPREASQWLPLAGGLATGVALIPACCRSAQAVALVAGGLLALGLPTRLLWGSVYLLSEWSTAEAALRIGGVAAGMLFVGWVLTKTTPPRANETPRETDHHEGSGAAACSASTHDGPTLSDTLVAPLLVFVMLGVAIVLATSGSLSYVRLAGVVVAAIAGAMLGGIGQMKYSEIGAGVPAAGPVVTTLAGGLILLGLLYAEVSTTNATLLAVALAAAGAKRGWTPACHWRQAVLRTMCCLVPLVLATAAAATEFSVATSHAEENPYLNGSPE